MATIRFSNRTAQVGSYKTGTPNYVDVDDTFGALPGMVAFTAKDTDDSWDDGDLMGVLVYVDENNYKVWWASWDAANEYLEVVTEEESVGTITDGTAVSVYGLPTALMMQKAIYELQIVTVTGTTHTTLDKDCGKVHRYTSGSAVTVTLGAGCRVNWHALHIQEGAGLVSFARASADTINGAASNIDTAGQYKTSYTYQPTEGAWIAAV